jgi:hypothetical protein
MGWMLMYFAARPKEKSNSEFQVMPVQADKAFFFVRKQSSFH